VSEYELTPRARADIFEIWAYVAEDNEGAADRVERAIYNACEFVADSPLRGHSRRDLELHSLRFWTLTRYPNYTVVYRFETAPVQVVAILHGKRNVNQVLATRPQ